MKNFNEMYLPELKEAAKELKIKGRSKMTKAALIAACEAARPKESKTVTMDTQKADEPILVSQTSEAQKVRDEAQREMSGLLVTMKTYLHYTNQITFLGGEMDCMNCDNKGWRPDKWHPDGSRCYWCNKQGQRFEQGEESQVQVTMRVIQTWQKMILGTMNKIQHLAKRNQAEKLGFSDVLIGKARNGWCAGRDEWHRLDACKMKAE